MSNPSAFVTLDKYIKDLTQERVMNIYARKKFERIDIVLKRVVGILDGLPVGSDVIRCVDMLKELLDTERPDVAACPLAPSLDSVKFSSVADGVPCHLEFEGER